MSGRYRLICVAPEVGDKCAPTDDLDRAILEADANYEVYDTLEQKYIPVSPDDWRMAWARRIDKVWKGQDG